MSAMQLVDRIEKRRFVGREFLLWLWFESEVFEGTLSTKAHGQFGLWIARQIVLSLGKEEVTRIKGAYPAGTREAKESLLRGKTPETAGLHLSWHEHQATFVFKAEPMAISGLSLPTVLGEEEEEAPPPEARPKGRRGRKAEAQSDEGHEAFYERMRLTREVEEILEALYRDFLTLRLGAAWTDAVLPALSTWTDPEGEVDADAYRAARDRALSTRKR
ncbi:hypothetical protein LZC95_50745 [Pendulispora brunnea]|uniref:Uncharacterized protein n=1 Tax=Pendulispora brunnea TaxID=2905690 RepID=A0ABZ2KE84_9BACT